MSTRKEKEGADSIRVTRATGRFDATIETQDDAWGAKPKDDYFSPVSGKSLAERSWDSPAESTGPIWPYVVGLSIVLVVLLTGLYWVLIKQPSADQLYAQISKTLAAEEDPSIVETEITQFLERFPEDKRRGEVEQYQLEIEARRLPRRLARTLQFRGTGHLSSIEREFLGALRISETQPAEALTRMNAIIHVYQGSGEARTAQCLAAVRQQVIWLESIVEQERAEVETLIAAAAKRIQQDESLTRAEQLERYESLLLLYGNDPSLAEALAPIHQYVAELHEPAS